MGNDADRAKLASVIARAVIFFGCIGYIVWVVDGCQSELKEKARLRQEAEAAEPKHLARPDPEPARQPSAFDAVSGAGSLFSAIEALKPYMEDTEDAEVSPSAVALAMWSNNHLGWNALAQKPDAKRTEVMKDPDAYRGSKVCVSGSVAEIRADRSVHPAVFHGGIVTRSADVVRFIAVGSTSGIVEGSQARFCGIVTGLQRYANVIGGVTEAVFEVGMFDLPENRSPAASTF